MPALDTIASFQTTAASTLAAGVMATGDPSAIRNFPDQAYARLVGAFYDDVTTPLTWRVRSPLLHDNVRGLEFYPGVAAPSLLFPPQAPQTFEAQDTLTFELSTAASTGKALGALGIYYSQLPGVAARLFSGADIWPLVANVKTVLVSVGSGANTAGQWYDLVLSTTENLLQANTDYAVLGATLDVTVAALAIKGPDTGNLRCGIPGGTNNPFGAQWFPFVSDAMGLPLIPVINAANVNATYISIISAAATGAASSFALYLAQLGRRLS